MRASALSWSPAASASRHSWRWRAELARDWRRFRASSLRARRPRPRRCLPDASLRSAANGLTTWFSRDRPPFRSGGDLSLHQRQGEPSLCLRAAAAARAALRAYARHRLDSGSQRPHVKFSSRSSMRISSPNRSTPLSLRPGRCCMCRPTARCSTCCARMVWRPLRPANSGSAAPASAAIAAGRVIHRDAVLPLASRQDRMTPCVSRAHVSVTLDL